MVERIESNMQTIVKQKMESEAVLNGMKAGLIVLDGHGRILRGNYAAQEIFPGLSTFAGRKPMELSLLQGLQDACDAALDKRRPGIFPRSAWSCPWRAARASMCPSCPSRATPSSA
jgi:two-component system, OmpR family, phosphate regulon sensor histidine kinase PhoR